MPAAIVRCTISADFLNSTCSTCTVHYQVRVFFCYSMKKSRRGGQCHNDDAIAQKYCRDRKDPPHLEKLWINEAIGLKYFFFTFYVILFINKHE